METSNPIFVAQSMSKLFDRLKTDRNEADLKQLKDYCTAENAEVSRLAADVLVKLVENKVLQVHSMLSEFITLLSINCSTSIVTKAICDLLKVDLRNALDVNEEYRCPYKLETPQHPFILILNKKPENWLELLDESKDLYENSSDEVAFYANEMLYPFYMYVICNPKSEVPEALQYKLWSYLIYVESQSMDATLHIVTWLQLSSPKHTLKACNFLSELALSEMNCPEMEEVLLLWLCSLLLQVIRNQQDPRVIINQINLLIGNEITHRFAEPILLIFCSGLNVCSSVYLYDVLKLCKRIVELNAASRFVLLSMKASLLPWMLHSCPLTTKAVHIAHEIMLFIDNQPGITVPRKQYSKTLDFLSCTNVDVYFALELTTLTEYETNHPSVLGFLEKCKTVPLCLLRNFYPYLSALVLCDAQQVVLDALSLLLKLAEMYKETTTQTMALILHKLSKKTDPETSLIFLKGLAKMGTVKENLPLILHTFELIRKYMTNLKDVPLILFYELWKIDVKCYPFLQNCFNVSTTTDDLWEFYVAKAHVLKEICTKRPELYGREIVAYFSEIINKCTDKGGALATALAIDGITALCNGGVIDIESTCNELMPIFDKEERVLVIKSFCKLLTEVSYFDASECPESLLKDILLKLWKYGVTYEDKDVVLAAYEALSCFTLEQVSLYLLEIIEFDSNKQYMTGFGLIQGTCWITLLLQSKPHTLEYVGDFLIKYISHEISCYRSGIYEVVENRKEPQNYNYLPQHSIVCALGNYLKAMIQKWNDVTVKGTYLQCLRILSHEYSKPLPPFDWCFLQELVHNEETRIYCIVLASHQVQLSGTARRFIQNYIEALTESNKEEDILTIYHNLKHLCNSIQPITLRPFIENTTQLAINKSDVQLFNNIFDILQSVLNCPDLHEANKSVICQIIVKAFSNLQKDSEKYNKLRGRLVALPKRYIDDLSSPSLWNNFTDSQIKTSIEIRCAVALSAVKTPLNWITEVVDAVSDLPLYHSYTLKQIAGVINFYKLLEISVDWTLEYLGHIQAIIANESVGNKKLQFLYDVYIVTIIILSGLDVFNDDFANTAQIRLRLFPQSVAQLIKNQLWQPHVLKIAEWSFYVTNYQGTPENYKVAFYQSLVALKHEDFFTMSNKWMKYLGNTIPKF